MNRRRAYAETDASRCLRSYGGDRTRVAARAGIDPSTLSHVFAGRQRLSPAIRAALVAEVGDDAADRVIANIPRKRKPAVTSEAAALLAKHGSSGRRVGALAGISQAHVSRMLNGKTPVSEAFRIALVLEVDDAADEILAAIPPVRKRRATPKRAIRVDEPRGDGFLDRLRRWLPFREAVS